jgi:probable F420-dependent oxidoreductase
MMPLRVGAVFPQTEIGADPGAVREWAQAVEGMGYTHILAYDHVLGASRRNRPDWGNGYDMDDMFHEIFVLFGYLAAITERVGLVTGVVILPQRQTVLVAKQAAEIDVLSGGRLRLGIGNGWNEVEYIGLNEDFHTRGARSAEQIEILRRLWTEREVSFEGRYHTIPEAGINPLPVQQPIPIWTGARAEAALRRTAQLADGWMPLGGLVDTEEKASAIIEQLHGYLREAGRDPASFGIEPHLSLSQVPEDGWQAHAEMWDRLGATHLCVSTMDVGYTSLAQHINALQRVQAAIGRG